MKKKLPPYNEEQIEFVSIPSEMFDISKGKGYNELLLINKTLEMSEQIKSNEAFFKVTGRYPIYNIRYFLNKASECLLEKHGNIYCDIKDHSLYDALHLGWCGHSFECRLFGVNTTYYKTNIAPLYVSCNDYDGKLLESVLFDFVKSVGGNELQLRFGREPHFGGVEGSMIDAISFSKEQDSFKGKIKRFVGNLIRYTMPWFKF